jgi:cell division protein FtsX
MPVMQEEARALRFVNVNTSCGSSFSVSPNPASDDVMVTATDPQDAAIAKAVSSPTKIYKLKINDQSGNIKKQYSYTAGSKSVTINVSNLMSGIYTLQIFDGKGWAAQKLIKQ